MSRKKTPEDLEREAQEADDARADAYRKQQDCSHYYAHAAEWHWETGQVRLLRCPECGEERYFEQVT